MGSQNYLGIYISKNTATVVCIDSQVKDGSVLGCFSVMVDKQEQTNMQALANLITQGCDERRWAFSEITVALDCAMFMQHSVHSEFNDPKRIRETVRFDAEEALATDIMDMTLAFEITSSGQEGSELTVFTAQRKILSDMLYALQQRDIDPVTIEPDVNCLSRFIRQKASSDASQQIGVLFGMLSQRNGYLVVPPESGPAGSRKASTVRTFLIGPMQNRTELLAREVLITNALVKSDESINCLKVFDSTSAIDYQKLSEKLGIETAGIDWFGAAGSESQIPVDCADPVDFVIAYGAALAAFDKVHNVNFRDDFSPYQGKKLRLQRALKFTAISVIYLFLIVGVYFQTQLIKENKILRQKRAKFREDYKAVMLGQEPPDKESPIGKLGNELRRIKDAKRGLITFKDEEIISSKLTLLLAAFNKCAAQTDLNIDSISTTTRDIIISGDTSSRQNRQKIFQAVRDSGLEIVREGYDLKGDRESFSITVVPKK